MKKKKLYSVLLWIPLVFYIVFIVWNILFKYVMPWELMSEGRYYSRSLNLIPFGDLISGNYNRLDLWGNIIVFIPLGIYCALFQKKKAKTAILCLPLIVSCLFEVLQYVLAIGASDVTDMITNTVGGIIGMLFYKFLASICRSDRKAEKVIVVLSTSMMVFAASIIILIYSANA